MKLQKHIESYFGKISDEEARELENLFKAKSLVKGEYLLKAGAYCKDFAFIESGILRVYVEHEEKEITQWLAGPESFITELSSFLFHQSSRWHIQALEDSKLYSISQSDYQKLQELIPRWPAMEKMFIAKCFSVLESRVFSHLSLNAEERYQHFSNIYPELIHQVPLQYLASLLGMSPETLSRIRKK